MQQGPANESRFYHLWNKILKALDKTSHRVIYRYGQSQKHLRRPVSNNKAAINTSTVYISISIQIMAHMHWHALYLPLCSWYGMLSMYILTYFVICFRWSLQELEAPMVHPERQLPLLFRVYRRKHRISYFVCSTYSCLTSLFLRNSRDKECRGFIHLSILNFNTLSQPGNITMWNYEAFLGINRSNFNTF